MKKTGGFFDKMEAKALKILIFGLKTCIATEILFIFYILKSNSYLEYAKLIKTLPSLVATVIIVFAGAIAFDALIKEKGGK
jgi:hypothetical protein